jgi:hypothetical protein
VRKEALNVILEMISHRVTVAMRVVVKKRNLLEAKKKHLIFRKLLHLEQTRMTEPLIYNSLMLLNVVLTKNSSNNFLKAKD